MSSSNIPSSVSRRHVLLVAWPIILSNLSTPLLGLVDTAVIGNLGDPALLGAIAVGAMIFSFLYWGFGFLRMGTTGLIAQARGAGDDQEILASLYRALLLAVGIGTAILALQGPLSAVAFSLIDGSPGVESAALDYFLIRIWGAPISLAHLVLLGYLLACEKTGAMLWIQILLNGTNIVLDILFVVVLGWGVPGIAAATLIAEIIALLAGLMVVFHHLRGSRRTLGVAISRLLDLKAVSRMLTVNRDIMIRTLCLIFAFAWFTNEGARAGDVVLAANAILMQFVSFSAFFLDGYALAAESLIGSAVGARNQTLLDTTLRYINELGLVTAAGVSVLFVFTGDHVIDLLTNAETVRETARIYLPWAIAAPLISVWCYLLDGVFIGATCTREMRNAMIVSLAAYLAAFYMLFPSMDNHGLWLAFMLYFVARALTLWFYLPNVRRAAV